MKTAIAIAAALLLLGLVAAPADAADPPGFGGCEVVEGPYITTVTVGPVDEDVRGVALRCYW